MSDPPYRAGNGQRSRKRESQGFLERFLLPFPLVFGTGMAAPVETMPGWLQAWAGVNPVSRAIEAVQGLPLGGPAAGPAAATLWWSGVFLAVFGTAAVVAYRRVFG